MRLTKNRIRRERKKNDFKWAAQCAIWAIQDGGVRELSRRRKNRKGRRRSRY